MYNNIMVIDIRLEKLKCFYTQSIFFVISPDGIIRGDNIPVIKSSITGKVVDK
jgi:hypothetical protein